MGLVAYLSLSGSGREVGWGGRLFEAGRLLTFSAFRMGAYSRWALIRGWALIRINHGKHVKNFRDVDCVVSNHMFRTREQTSKPQTTELLLLFAV